MRNSGERDETSTIAKLNDLLQLDHDAVEAYTIAIDMAREPRYRETLTKYRADHKRHIEQIGGLVRARGGLPTEMPHATGPLKLAVQAIGSLAGDDALLLAFKAVEGQARDKYERATHDSHPTDVAAVIALAFADEDKHYRWVEHALAERGLGQGTLPHALAGVVERVHKAIADPIEAVGRTIMENVGNVVGTTRRRGGSAAPSPLDVVGGMMAQATGGESADTDRTHTAARPDPDVDEGDPRLAL